MSVDNLTNYDDSIFELLEGYEMRYGRGNYGGPPTKKSWWMKSSMKGELKFGQVQS